MKIRVGFGFDVHQLVEGCELWLGGVLLEHTKGLLGHSDADVLLHAVCVVFQPCSPFSLGFGRGLSYHQLNIGHIKSPAVKLLHKPQLPENL